MNIPIGQEVQASLEKIVQDEAAGNVSTEPYALQPGDVWASTRPDIVTVSADGKLLGHKSGSAEIIVRTAKHRAYAFVNVELEPWMRETLGLIADKPYFLLEPQGKTQVNVREMTANGVLRGASRQMVFSTAQPEVVNVSETGELTALKPGLAVVRAEMGPLRTEVLVEVRNAGEDRTWQPPFQWTLFERLPAYDKGEELGYEYSGIRLVP
jgi:hypothetical protein